MNRVIAVLISISLLAASACSNGNAKESGTAPHPLQLKTAVAQEQTVSDTLEIPARIQADPARVVRVFPPAGGRLIRVTVIPGDLVSKGKVVAILESSDVSQARSDLIKAQAEAERSQRALERSKMLLDHQVISEREYEDAKAEQISNASELARAKARLQVLGASPNGADNEVDVRAPISGTVLDIGSTTGELSKSTDNANPICTIADLNTVWVMGDVFEKDLPDVRAGEPITFSVNAYPNRQWDGRISLVSQAVDPNTRTVKVRVVSTNPKRELKPDMFASLQVRRPSRVALVVPASALLHEGGDTTVMVKNGDSYERRLVAVKTLGSDKVAVTTGLKSGETVVTEGAALLRSNGDE
ncbi:MAG TPA: efflux RND transporter periplasmic adaptor subunit [Terriglobales bacterium]|nr:efflux RND transporter periplasmic adaptor subunit [Terriglobales bacterium]